MFADKHWKRRSAMRESRGQAIVEGALTLLLLFVFIFAIFEAGRFLQVRQTLTDAAREGARRAIVPLTRTDVLATDAMVQDFVFSYLEAASIHVVKTSIVIDRTTYPGFILVQVPYTYRAITISMFGLLNMTLTGRALMRDERT